MYALDHFAVIQSICRIGLASGDEKFRKQVERLRDRLQKSHDKDSLEAIESLLNSGSRAATLQPSKVELSRGPVGEMLDARISPPFDKESSAPLAQIIMNPGGQTFPPILTEELKIALDAFLSEWKDGDKLRSMGIEPTHSCLIFGQPGTGKTVLAMHMAERLGLPVVLARLDGMMSSFLGTTARNIGTLFEFANRYRCLLLLDEFDALAKLRDDPQEVGEIKRVVNTLLQCLDARGEKGLTVAITNHPALLDPAIWRRFEVKIEMPLPPAGAREQLIRNFLVPIQVHETGVQLLVWASEGATGAEVQSIINALKRFIILEGGDSANLSLGANDVLLALQRYYVTSANLDERPHLQALRQEPRNIARKLLEDENGSFTQVSVAQLLGRDQATISRWMKEEPALLE